MVTVTTESGWQGTDVFLKFLGDRWSENSLYLTRINETTDTKLVLKSLSDYYYGLRNLKSILIFFIEADAEAKDRIDTYFANIKTLTGDQEIMQCSFDWQQIYSVRNTLLDLQDELFRIMGSKQFLVPINKKRKYDDLQEELDVENA